MIREAYTRAAALFVDTVAAMHDAQWQQPALGVWTVRDLVGHTSRALLTVESYLAQPASHVELARPVDYFLQAQAALADPASVAARGRESGAALGPAPAQAVREIATRVLALVQATTDDALVRTPLGGMRLIDYLPSRVFELTVHTLDLATALSTAVTIPPEAAAISLHLLADLAAVQPSKTAALLLAGTGRGALPSGYSVL